DVVVQLPGGKQVVIDAKVPMAAYLDAIEARDEDSAKVHLQSHVRQVRDHVRKLAAKSYWSQFDDTPECVVMFVDEALYRVALEQPAQIDVIPRVVDSADPDLDDTDAEIRIRRLDEAA